MLLLRRNFLVIESSAIIPALSQTITSTIKYDKNDFIRFIVTEYKDYFKSEDEEVWEAGMKEFRKMIKKVVDKVNLGIKDAGLEGITFYSEDLHEAMYFYLESDRVKEDKQ